MKKLIIALMLTLQATIAQAGDAARLKLAEDYLNTHKNFQADFEQYTVGEALSKGTFYLKRPGKFMWQYSEPTEERMVSNGNAVYYIDGQDGEVTQVPTDPAITQLFTGEKLDLSAENIHFIGTEETDTLFSVELALFDGKESVGRAILGFSKDPLQLTSLTTQDPSGHSVFIRFSNIHTDRMIPGSLFHVQTPFME